MEEIIEKIVKGDEDTISKIETFTKEELLMKEEKLMKCRRDKCIGCGMC
jgi:ferredoxin